MISLSVVFCVVTVVWMRDNEFIVCSVLCGYSCVDAR